MVQFYSDNNNIYSVDMMFSFINIFKPKFIKINVSEYLSQLDFNCWGDPTKILYSPKKVLDNPKKYIKEYNRIEKANFNYPIIIADNFIVDGVHRLTKAYLQNKKQINAFIFDKKLLKKFLINKKGNWDKAHNLKINDLIELFFKRFNNENIKSIH